MKTFAYALTLVISFLAAHDSNANESVTSVSSPFDLFTSANAGLTYAYAPSIIKDANGIYHAYFCSTGSGRGPYGQDMDHIRELTSRDLQNWSGLLEILQPTGFEQSNCDPSVVYYDAGDGPYYYMFYGGNVNNSISGNLQTVGFVARSKGPDGPFWKYTQNGTWQPQGLATQCQNGSNCAKIIISPFHAGSVYGAGQPTVVVKNGKLYMWYLDDSANMTTHTNWLYFTTSTDAIHWAPPIQTNMNNASVDVKFDDATGNFIMFLLPNVSSPTAQFALASSTDGVTWTAPQVVANTGTIPPWANNIGVSGDNRGHLIPGKTLIGYGAPFSPNYVGTTCPAGVQPPNCGVNWNMFGNTFNLQTNPGAGDYINSRGTVFYYNGAGQYCGYNSGIQYLQDGGVANEDMASVQNFDAGWSYVGVCQSATKEGYYQLPSGGIYYCSGARKNYSGANPSYGVNGQGFQGDDVACGFSSWYDYVASQPTANPTVTSIQYTPLRWSITTGCTAHPVGFYMFPNGAIIYYNGKEHSCGIASTAQYIRSGGNPTYAGINRITTFPGIWSYDGICGE